MRVSSVFLCLLCAVLRCVCWVQTTKEPMVSGVRCRTTDSRSRCAVGVLLSKSRSTSFFHSSSDCTSFTVLFLLLLLLLLSAMPGAALLGRSFSTSFNGDFNDKQKNGK